MEPYRLFFEAGLAIGLSFMIGIVVGLFFSSYLHRRIK